MILFKTPKWFEVRGIVSLALLPLSGLYWLISVVRRFALKPKVIEGKIVICVGNITVGGGGKTPTCLFIGDLLANSGYSVCFLTRGYGRKSKEFIKIRDGDSPARAGDEPLLLARRAATYVFSKTSDIFENVEQITEDVIIMDDGLQNPRITKDISCLVIDGSFGFGNGFIFPAGALRQSYRAARRQIDCTIVINGDSLLDPDVPNFRLASSVDVSGLDKTKQYIAFSGLARNQKFFNSLARAGIDLDQTISFPDHYVYKESDIRRLIALGRGLLTTEKDFVKLRDFKGSQCIIPISMSLIVDMPRLCDDLDLKKWLTTKLQNITMQNKK